MNNGIFKPDTVSRSNEIAEVYSLELKQSARKLKRLIKVCTDELNQAEDAFNSKPKIMEIAKPDIFDQITLISGCAVQIHYLGNHYKARVIEQVSQSWEEQIEKLRQKWFIDTKQQQKKGIGWGEKNSFIQEIPSEVESLYQNLIDTTRKNLSEMYKKITVIDMELIYNLVMPTSQIKLNKALNSVLGNISSKFCNPEEYLANNIKERKKSFSAPAEALVNKGWGDILWEEVIQFKNETILEIVQIVTLIFDNRVEQVTQAVEKVLSFYNDFLERQERYQQETPEQREAEKAWIDQQRQQLEQVQRGIEAILNAS